MFKFVVLCVFAAAVAEPEPGFLYGTPLAYSSLNYPTVIPTINQAGLIARPSFAYQTPYGYSHFIKKRSADPEPEAKPEPEANPEPEAKPDPQLLAYTSPNYYYPGALTTPAINPFIPSYSSYYPYSYQAQIPLAAHLIKKRSAQFIAPTTYVPSTYAVPSYNPYYPTTYIGNKFYPAADTVVYGQHLIKKRSAVLPLPSTYVTPYALQSGYYSPSYPAVSTTYYGNNYYAGSPILGLHAIKKRSAQLASPAFYTPTTYAAPHVYSPTYTAASPLFSSLPYVASPYAYSTYIKK